MSLNEITEVLSVLEDTEKALEVAKERALSHGEYRDAELLEYLINATKTKVSDIHKKISEVEL